MKTKIFLLGSLLSLGVAASALAGDGFQHVDASQLPPRVRRAFDAQTRGGERIHDVRAQSVNGRMIYEIDTGRDGGRIMRIAADGEILNSGYEPRRDDRDHDRDRVGVPVPPPVAMVPPPGPVAVVPAPITVIRVDDLPYHVRQRLEHDHHGRRVSRITRETVEGRSTFGIQFSDGNTTLFYSEDGAVMPRR